MSPCPTCVVANLLAVGGVTLAVVLGRAASWLQERRRQTAASGA